MSIRRCRSRGVDHRAGQKASQSGTTRGIAVLPVRWKVPLGRCKADPLCWQARGPGFESPMLHPNFELRTGHFESTRVALFRELTTN